MRAALARRNRRSLSCSTGLALVVALLAGATAWAPAAAAQSGGHQPEAPPAADTLATEEAPAQATVAAAGPVASVSGYGWGHGRGLGQYGALGYAIDHGWSRDKILDHFYGNTVGATKDLTSTNITVRLMAVDGGPTDIQVDTGALAMRVDGGSWVKTGARGLTIALGGSGFSVTTRDGCGGAAFETKTVAGSRIDVRPYRLAGSYVDIGSLDQTLAESLQVCTGGGSSTYYRGEIRIHDDAGKQRTVNAVRLEHYLMGVVPREMPASWAELKGGKGAQALEAQAVAARTYALSENRYPYARTCDTTACQVYAGRAVKSGDQVTVREDVRANAAILYTLGMYRARAGQPARSEFSSSTGGYTAGGTFPAVPDAGDSVSYNPNHSWKTSVPVAAIEQRYGKSPLTRVEVTERNGLGADGGRVREVRLTFGDGSVITRTGNQFRLDFGLRSDWFTVKYTPPKPPSQPKGAPVLTWYTESEYADLKAAADWLGLSPQEFQRTAAWVTAFLIALNGPYRPEPLQLPPEEGPHHVTTVYGDEDVPKLLTVMDRWVLTPSQAQEVSTTLFVYLTGLDRAAKGG